MKAWKIFLENLEKKIGSVTVRKWLYTLKVIKFDACNLYLEAEDEIHAKWFQEHIKPILANTFYNENYHKIKIHLSIKNDLQKKTIQEKKNDLISDDLEPYFKFPFFITNEKNLMTLKILQEATKKKSFFNPIFIYGPKGSGKTHLLQACAHKFKEKKNLNVFYINCQTFTNHVVDAIRNNLMLEFREKYRNLDVLIIDDIHILSNKFATQEEFFHTFNTLHSSNKTIIISSNCLANSLSNIETRLISRFEWGISLGLEKLEKKQLKYVLKNDIAILNLKLNFEIEKYLLDNFTNIISLKKALKTLALNSHLDNLQSLSLLKAKSYLSNLVEEENQTQLTVERIIQEISKYFAISSNDILGKSQTKECTLPRQLSMYFCRNILKMPFMSIGNYFKRDHSTVITSVNTIKKLLEIKDMQITNSHHELVKKFSNLN